MRTYTVNTPDYAALLNTRHYDTLKRLSVIEGKIYFDTGAFLQPIDDRMEMFERSHNEPAYIEQLDMIADEDRRQKEYLRSRDF
jgi:hypothetical protein